MSHYLAIGLFSHTIIYWSLLLIFCQDYVGAVIWLVSGWCQPEHVSWEASVTMVIICLFSWTRLKIQSVIGFVVTSFHLKQALTDTTSRCRHCFLSVFIDHTDETRTFSEEQATTAKTDRKHPENVCSHAVCVCVYVSEFITSFFISSVWGYPSEQFDRNSPRVYSN